MKIRNYDNKQPLINNTIICEHLHFELRHVCEKTTDTTMPRGTRMYLGIRQSEWNVRRKYIYIYNIYCVTQPPPPFGWLCYLNASTSAHVRNWYVKFTKIFRKCPRTLYYTKNEGMRCKGRSVWGSLEWFDVHGTVQRSVACLPASHTFHGNVNKRSLTACVCVCVPVLLNGGIFQLVTGVGRTPPFYICGTRWWCGGVWRSW